MLRMIRVDLEVLRQIDAARVMPERRLSRYVVDPAVRIAGPRSQSCQTGVRSDGS
jgi:hypothetical protein